MKLLGTNKVNPRMSNCFKEIIRRHVVDPNGFVHILALFVFSHQKPYT